MSGELLWDRSFAGGPAPAAVAAPSGETLYVGDHADPAAPLVVALDPRTGIARWQGLHGAGLAELTVGSDAVYAAGGGHVTAWDSTAGESLWTWTWTAAAETGGGGAQRASARPPGADGLVHVVADATVGPRRPAEQRDRPRSRRRDIPVAGGPARRTHHRPPRRPGAAPDGPVVTAVGTTLYAITAG